MRGRCARRGRGTASSLSGALMESLIGRFEATGSDGRSYTVLAYATLTMAGAAAEVTAGERLTTSDGLTVVRLTADLYFTILTGVRLTRRPAASSAEGMRGPP